MIGELIRVQIRPREDWPVHGEGQDDGDQQTNCWYGKTILVGQPIEPPYLWKKFHPECDTDLLWPIAEPELLQSLGRVSYVCRCQIIAGD